MGKETKTMRERSPKSRARYFRGTLVRGTGVRRLQVTVFRFLFLFLFFLFFDRLELERIYGNDLEIGAALGAGNDFTLVDLIFLNVQVAFTFRTINHECLRARSYPDNI